MQPTNKNISVNNKTTAYRLTNLIPFTSYNVGIAASTIAGTGPKNSPSVKFVTSETGKLT